MKLKIEIDLDNLTPKEAEIFGELVGKASIGNRLPKEGETFYILNSAGGIAEYVFGDAIDVVWSKYELEKCLKQGNLSTNREELEFKAKKREVETALQRYADEHNGNIDCVFYIFYNGSNIGTIGTYIDAYCGIKFSSRQIALDAIKFVGEEDVKKYYLGVNEC